MPNFGVDLVVIEGGGPLVPCWVWIWPTWTKSLPLASFSGTASKLGNKYKHGMCHQSKGYEYTTITVFAIAAAFHGKELCCRRNDAKMGASNSLHTPRNTASMYIEVLIFYPQASIITVQTCKSGIAKGDFFKERLKLCYFDIVLCCSCVVILTSF